MRKLYLGLITFILTLLSSHSSHAAIVLNEMMPCNVSTYMNEYDNYTGWVEVYNNSGSSANLMGYIFVNEYVKSGVLNSRSWTITQNVTIPAYGYEIFFFDEESGNRHADYKIETSGGSLILLDYSRRKVDELNYQQMYPHVSWGKCGNSEGYMLRPTPKAVNAACLSESRRVQNPSFGTPPGFYNSAISVSLQSEPGAVIYYTTNGSEPTEQSTRYTNPIAVSRTTVIRARAYINNVILSEIVTGSFIYSDTYHSSCGGFTVPVVSISTNPDNFFGNQYGIYVAGTNGVTGKCQDWDPGAKNYNRDWKRPVNFEYFVNGQQAVSQELDAAIMGGCSRQYTQKSLKLTASKKLGNHKIPYDFFPVKQGNEYKSLQLRNGGNDYDNTRIRDAFMQSLIQGRMNVDYQAYLPVAFYINGEYWGQMSMTERSNKDFVYSNYGLGEEEIDLLKITGGGVSASTGDVNAYNNLIAQAKTGTTSPDYYEKMNRLMDLDEYIDYQIFEQYVVNTDWPGNNTKIWREKTNGRFRWIVYDTDFGFGLYGPGADNYTDVNLNMINFCLGKNTLNWANREAWMVELFENLMKNETFRQKFLNKFILHLGTTFVPSRVEHVRDSVYRDATSEICAHKNRFNSWNSSMSSTFGNQRAGVIYNQLKDYFNLGNQVNLSISANISNADFIINGDRLNMSRYNGKYYVNKDLSVQPVAPPGYRFVSWNLTSSPVTESILNANTIWKYYYKGNQPTGNWQESSYNDAAWDSGKGKFGYANDRTYDVTLNYGGDPNNKWVTAYFRTSFTISDLSAVDEIQGTLLYDDGVVIYVNGQEVKRFNMNSGPVSYGTFAIVYVNDETASFTIDKSYFRTGTNVIAVEVHQDKPESSDLTFKLDLSMRVNGSGGTSSQVQTYNATVTGDVNLVATFAPVTYVKPALFINELCASNSSRSGFTNEYGIYADWIEIYNAEDVAIDLAGMYLTENTKQVTYQFPTNAPLETTIPPKGYKIIWADKEMWQGPLHANFKLTAGSASTLTLSQMVNGQQMEIDRVSYPNTVGANKSESYGRVTDGASQWKIFEYCNARNIPLSTPGEANGTKECQLQYTITVTAGANGTIMPDEATTVNQGDNQTFTFTPATCYRVDQVLVNGLPVTVSGNSYTFTNVQSNSAISVTFEEIPYITIIPVAICSGESYDFHGRELAATGVYSESMQTIHGCDSIVELRLTVNPLPGIPAIIPNGNTLTSSAADGYQWYSDNTPIFGATEQSYTCTQQGGSTYFVEVTNEYGCSSRSDEIVVIVTGISEIGLSNIKVYPNPTNGKVYIKTEDGTTPELKLYSIDSRLLQHVYNTEIDLSGYSTGVYLLSIDGKMVKIIRE